MSAPIDILIQLNRVFKTFKIMNSVKSIEPITEKDEIEKFQTLKEQVFEEYADYSLEKLYYIGSSKTEQENMIGAHGEGVKKCLSDMARMGITNPIMISRDDTGAANTS